MRIVLDSNVLLIALGRRSKYRPIWDGFLAGQFKLIVCEDVMYEYEEILQRHSAPGVAELMTEILIESPDVIHQQVYYLWNAIKEDPDDNKFFDIAVAANADHLVNNDAHFKILGQLPFPKVNVISADVFLDLLDNLQHS